MFNRSYFYSGYLSDGKGGSVGIFSGVESFKSWFADPDDALASIQIKLSEESGVETKNVCTTAFNRV
jgi:hypothetical protein